MKITTQLSDSNFNYICHSLAQKKIPYISVSQFKEDYQEQRVYILEEKGKPVAMCSLVWSDKHQNYAINFCFKPGKSSHLWYSMARQFFYATNLGKEWIPAQIHIFPALVFL